MGSITSQQGHVALAHHSSFRDDENIALGNPLDSSDDEGDMLTRTEDEHPLLQEVIGCRITGKRFNSSKGFIYHYQKKT